MRKAKRRGNVTRANNCSSEFGRLEIIYMEVVTTKIPSIVDIFEIGRISRMLIPLLRRLILKSIFIRNTCMMQVKKANKAYGKAIFAGIREYKTSVRGKDTMVKTQ